MLKATLVLSDGLVFEGESFGASGEAAGEVVFNTSMTGYQEILTDPSYTGQIVAMTYTQMGNYGVNPEDVESKGGPKVEGFIVKENFDCHSNWRSKGSLDSYLKDHGKVGIQGIDTRALTSHLRDNGSMMGIIATGETNAKDLLKKIRAHAGIAGVDLVKDVTTKSDYSWNEKLWEWGKEKQRSRHLYQIVDRAKPKVVVYDFGVKFNILRNLFNTGFDITVVPAKTSAEDVLGMEPDGIFLSNGPGDPEAVTYAISNVRKLIGKKPIFGICLGHQIIGLALGGKTYKLKFGHHGGNHPVKDLESGKVEITSQNHNYCVDVDSLKGKVELTHVNLYDNTAEGMRHNEYPLFSVQYHPEAGPGPNDSMYLFRRFMDMVEKNV
ncbi:MAG: glutamine-hydrolyzing carbamoyl-phosphate synthase small subunit [Nitrospirae bacterium]|nr:glutamine-hydrolyzing carbamoyl-phosphate synthase small subunit [Nitrospirota bacterium]MBF0534469.1 glutamine-hydrolyzing carbamoyl-phosphate synthase small subunit [Nitrospirota bacterium]MBF0617095.1 glutamine-hydrolyzing carbamoyl-phosphate synthase small subunit [Nitrospirota bacterium]